MDLQQWRLWWTGDWLSVKLSTGNIRAVCVCCMVVRTSKCTDKCQIHSIGWKSSKWQNQKTKNNDKQKYTERKWVPRWKCTHIHAHTNATKNGQTDQNEKDKRIVYVLYVCVWRMEREREKTKKMTISFCIHLQLLLLFSLFASPLLTDGHNYYCYCFHSQLWTFDGADFINDCDYFCFVCALKA